MPLASEKRTFVGFLDDCLESLMVWTQAPVRYMYQSHCSKLERTKLRTLSTIRHLMVVLAFGFTMATTIVGFIFVVQLAVSTVLGAVLLALSSLFLMYKAVKWKPPHNN